MPKNHSYYQPSEYEEMLLAAKWVRIEDIDEDYAKYLRAADKTEEGAMSYIAWQNTRKSWDELNDKLAEMEKQHGTHLLWDLDETREEANRILDEMCDLEVALGY